ncbi:hypothetical protein ACOMHN_063994 [Nucella lapillus]
MDTNFPTAILYWSVEHPMLMNFDLKSSLFCDTSKVQKNPSWNTTDSGLTPCGQDYHRQWTDVMWPGTPQTAD